MLLQRLYQRLTELLNEPDDGSLFRDFLRDVQQEPSINEFGPRSALYTFPELGITLKTVYGHCFQITLWIGNLSVQSKACKAYSGGFPCNVKSSDGRDTLRRKFGIE